MRTDFDIKNPKKKFKKTERVPPKGYDNANDFFEDMYMDENMIWMGQNTNHLHDDTIANAMIDAIRMKTYCRYPAPEGFSELKKLVLKDLGFEDEEVLLTSGATESLYLCMQALLTPEDNVILSDPGYFIIGDFANRFANEVRYVPIYDEKYGYKLTPDLLRENMDENTRMAILIDPLNPLGSSYTEDELKEFAEIAKENDIYLLHDVTYKDFAREHFLVENYAPGQTLTIYSFSKIFGMAGLRIGGVVSSKPIIDAIKNAVVNDLGVNIISQYGAIAGLKSKDVWFEDMRQTCFENQRLIKEMVDTVDGIFLPVYPSDANMMVIDIYDTGINPKDLSNYLIQKGLFTREGEYTSDEFGERYLRVSFSIPTEEIKIFCEEFPKAIEALRK
ncbi:MULTISPECIES: pyridoxal phosphate-dependent aminotransferase [Methanobrevibacter]|uniref:Aminotransferase n=1 Tax=Methanobrevibacter gottschalkii DSM 11977 TaxID=1122229 RepID=A0A3N5C931_9EURY|nr:MULTISPECIES: pyridoxal phosphate-dependent aminotransferase [Methanobrevibacter]RPF53111.1 aspartate/methionine/tyrosine aminotransferase [Methanobrevibacter gottschalkii DSM 11977]